jgi:protein pelota
MVIAGPGFAKDQFKEYLDAEAVRREIRCSNCLSECKA